MAGFLDRLFAWHGLRLHSRVDFKPVYVDLADTVVITGFYHAKLGLQTVIEDYIGNHSTRTVMIIVVSFLAAILAVTGVFSILRIAFAT